MFLNVYNPKEGIGAQTNLTAQSYGVGTPQIQHLRAAVHKYRPKVCKIEKTNSFKLCQNIAIDKLILEI